MILFYKNSLRIINQIRYSLQLTVEELKLSENSLEIQTYLVEYSVSLETIKFQALWQTKTLSKGTARKNAF